MIMPRGQPLLLPVNPVFIVASLLVGLAINFLPLGRVVWTPDILMLLLAFWVVHQPQRIGMALHSCWVFAWMCTSRPGWASMPWPTRCCRLARWQCIAVCCGSVFRLRHCRCFPCLCWPTRWSFFCAWSEAGFFRDSGGCSRPCWRPCSGPWPAGCCWRRSAARRIVTRIDPCEALLEQDDMRPVKL